MKLSYAGFAALALGIVLATNQAMAESRGPAPTQGTASCIAGFSANPGTWKQGTSFVCTSEKPACPNGTIYEQNTGAISGPLVNQAAQTNHGQKGDNGAFFYSCLAPAPNKPTT